MSLWVLRIEALGTLEVGGEAAAAAAAAAAAPRA